LTTYVGRPREATRHDTARVAAQTAFASLGVTWTTALLGGLLYDLSLPNPGGHERWIPIVLQVALNVGGLIAVFRSAQTRTETRAALREVSELRIAVLTAPLIEAADRAHRAMIVADLASGVESMLRLAVGLALLPREVDRASFWILDTQDLAPSQWFIFAATTTTNASHPYLQPSVNAHTTNAGMIANLAVDQPWPADIPGRRAGDVLLVGRDLANHPWYQTYEGERDAEGIAVVLLRHGGGPAGALCFTWEHEIPTAGKQADEMIDILGRWGARVQRGAGPFVELP